MPTDWRWWRPPCANDNVYTSNLLLINSILICGRTKHFMIWSKSFTNQSFKSFTFHRYLLLYSVLEFINKYLDRLLAKENFAHKVAPRSHADLYSGIAKTCIESDRFCILKWDILFAMEYSIVLFAEKKIFIAHNEKKNSIQIDLFDFILLFLSIRNDLFDSIKEEKNHRKNIDLFLSFDLMTLFRCVDDVVLSPATNTETFHNRSAIQKDNIQIWSLRSLFSCLFNLFKNKYLINKPNWWICI